VVDIAAGMKIVGRAVTHMIRPDHQSHLLGVSPSVSFPSSSRFSISCFSMIAFAAL
jgi:hypothetical protein